MAIKLIRIYPVLRIIRGARTADTPFRNIVACYQKKQLARNHALKASRIIATIIKNMPKDKYLEKLPDKLLFDPEFNYKEILISYGYNKPEIHYHSPEPLKIWRDTDLLNAMTQSWKVESL